MSARSASARLRMSSATATAAAVASLEVAPFTSMQTGTCRSLARSRTASRLGIRIPANSGLNEAPASRRCNSSQVNSRAYPLPFVDCSRVPCIIARRPSRVICTSPSISSAPKSTARANESSVFSGTCDDWPRWAMTRGRELLRHGLAPGSSTANPSSASSAQMWAPRVELALSSGPIHCVNWKTRGRTDRWRRPTSP